LPITDAVILAGGFGTRLRPLTTRTPKALLPVGGRPFLETLFVRLAQAGVKRVVLSVHHQAAILDRALPGLRRFSLHVSLRREPRPLGTGGAIRFAWPDPAKACLVLNGDVLSDFDVRELQREHRLRKAAATLWAITVENTEAFGVLETDGQGRVSRFVEKPRPGQSASRLINAGLYALDPAVLKLIPAGRPVSVEREVFPRLLAEGLRVGVCAAAGPVYWNDIGTPEAYLRANLDVVQGRLWQGRGMARRLWGRPDRGLNLIAASARVAPDARVTLSVLGPDCRVDAGARVEGSVLMKGCRVETQAALQGVLLSERVQVGARCALKPGSVLGAGSRLAEDSRL
jgi:mannose-1-phosphate guanylyltransferase